MQTNKKFLLAYSVKRINGFRFPERQEGNISGLFNSTNITTYGKLNFTTGLMNKNVSSSQGKN
jgi:hypothetical protein